MVSTKEIIDYAEKLECNPALWDGYSYGTAQAIAQAVMRNKPVKIINLR